MKTYRTRKAGKGFTLIELMITVIILGVLMAIALPAYQNSMIKSRRADAMRDLMELASRQERFYAQNSSYTIVLDTAAGLNFLSSISGEGHYKLTATNAPCTDITRCYTLAATPVSGGLQEKDVLCAVFTLNSLGQRSASGTLGSECW